MSSYVTGKIASKKFDSMLEPLLSDDESSTGSDSDADSDASSKVELEKKSPMSKLKELIGKSSRHTHPFI